MEARPSALAGAPTLRLAVAADEPFLRELYRSTRAQELAALGWSEERVRAFCDQQFDAQAASYAGELPQAQHFVVVFDGVPGGRVIEARIPEGILVADLSLMPGRRGRGWGNFLLARLQEQARAAGADLLLHAMRDSPELAWYQRHGFVIREEQGLHFLLAWDALISR